jgi:hypothetical protein
MSRKKMAFSRVRALRKVIIKIFYNGNKNNSNNFFFKFLIKREKSFISILNLL